MAARGLEAFPDVERLRSALRTSMLARVVAQELLGQEEAGREGLARTRRLLEGRVPND